MIQSRKFRAVVAALIVVLMVAAVLSGSNTIAQQALVQATEKTQRQLREYVACAAQWDDSNNARTRALVPATNRERDATRAVLRLSGDFIIAAAKQPPLPERELIAMFLKLPPAYVELEAATVAADKARAEHPVPEPLSRVCTIPD